MGYSIGEEPEVFSTNMGRYFFLVAFYVLFVGLGTFLIPNVIQFFVLQINAFSTGEMLESAYYIDKGVELLLLGGVFYLLLRMKQKLVKLVIITPNDELLINGKFHKIKDVVFIREIALGGDSFCWIKSEGREFIFSVGAASSWVFNRFFWESRVRNEKIKYLYERRAELDKDETHSNHKNN